MVRPSRCPIRIRNARRPRKTDGRLAQAVMTVLDELKVDALVYPSWNNLPRLIGDLPWAVRP